MGFKKKISDFLIRLGLDQNDFYKTSDLQTSNFPNELIQKIIKLKIDAVYFFGENPTLLFKFTKIQDNNEIYQTLLKSWNFDKAPILFHLTESNLTIYNTFIFPDKNNLHTNIIGTQNNIKQYNLSNLSSEDFWESKKNTFNNKNRINKRLLQNIIDAKQALLHHNLDEKYIHSIIGRSLFLRYIGDRKLIAGEEFYKIENLFLNKENLYNSFAILKKNFSGDLFPVTNEEFNSISKKHLSILHTLFSGGDIISGQQSLFSYYDFSIIPIKLISQIYEKFLHDGDNSSQAYYTPLATVDLVFEQLMGTTKIDQKELKILDPSCGSGIFLVTFLKKYFEYNKQEITPQNVLNFVHNSIYGIDVDEEAIKITIFSLYITILEFFEQPAIQAHDFKFPDLLNKNFFVVDYFNPNFQLEKKLGKFDLIVGNPPWGTIQESVKYYIPYCKNNNFAISDKQIAQAFMYRVSDFMKLDTLVAMVIPSKIFYNSNANKFRNTFLSLFDVKAVIEMSLERHKTFNKAIHPSAIIFYTKEKGEDNTFTHLTLYPSIFYEIFQMFIFTEENTKMVSQEEIHNNDWLWKPLLYGSQYDIDFLKKIKSNFTSILNYLNQHNTDYGTGLIYAKSYSKPKPLPLDIYKHYKLLQTERKTNTFFANNIDLNNSKKLSEVYEDNNFHDKGSIKSYTGPHLLIKRGVSLKGLTIGVTEENCAFKNSIFGIQLNDLQVLNFLAALYTSNLYNYYLFMTSSSWGVERPEVTMQEHRQLPIPKHIETEDIVILSKLYQELKLLSTENSNIDGLFEKNHQEIISCKENINLYVNRLFKLKSLEVELIDYALKIYPQISENKISKDKPSNSQIEKYIDHYINEVQIAFHKKSNNFHPIISKNDRFIFIYFENKSYKQNKKYSWVNNISGTINNIIETTINFSFEKITSDIAFQRKVFGIDGVNFYLIKPNLANEFHLLNSKLDATSFIEYRLYND